MGTFHIYFQILPRDHIQMNKKNRNFLRKYENLRNDDNIKANIKRSYWKSLKSSLSLWDKFILNIFTTKLQSYQIKRFTNYADFIWHLYMQFIRCDKKQSKVHLLEVIEIVFRMSSPLWLLLIKCWRQNLRKIIEHRILNYSNLFWRPWWKIFML